MYYKKQKIANLEMNKLEIPSSAVENFPEENGEDGLLNYTRLLDLDISPEELGNEFEKLTEHTEVNEKKQELLEKRNEHYAKALSENLVNLKEKLPQTPHGRNIFRKAAKNLWRATKIAVGAWVISGIYSGVDLDKQEGFSFKEKAKEELLVKGITSDQEYSAYKPGISEMLYEGITPLGYQDESSSQKGSFGKDFFTFLENHGMPNTGMLQEFVPNLVLGRENRGDEIEKIKNDSGLDSTEKEKAYHEKAWTSSRALYKIAGHSQMPKLDDAWRLYLGMPQEDNTFGISDYQPSRSKDDKYYFKIKGFWDDFESYLKKRNDRDFKEVTDALTKVAKNQQELEELVDKWATTDEEKEAGEYIKKGLPFSGNGLRDYIEFLSSEPGKKMDVKSEVRNGDKQDDIMFHYTMSCGQDEKGCYIAYYDKWDLASFFSENIVTKGVGKPFEIYDRLYYDPVTFEPVAVN